jgi:hypothetical protein
MAKTTLDTIPLETDGGHAEVISRLDSLFNVLKVKTPQEITDHFLSNPQDVLVIPAYLEIAEGLNYSVQRRDFLQEVTRAYLQSHP